MTVFSNGVCVVALEVLVQARGVLLEMSVRHGEVDDERIDGLGRGQLETVHLPFFILFICPIDPDARS